MDQEFNQQLSPVSPASEAGPGGRKEFRAYSVLAWLAILGVALSVIVLHSLPLAPTQDEDPVGLLLMRLQGEYLVGVVNLVGADPNLATQANQLNTGTLPQRQRYIVLAAELIGPEAAGQLLAELDQMIEQELFLAPQSFEVSQSEAAVQEILRELYAMDEQGPENDLGTLPADLTVEQRTLLVGELDWFGELALYPPETDDLDGRAAVIAPARRVAIVLIGGVIAAFLAMGAGFVLLAVVVVLGLTGRIKSALVPPRHPPGIYIETFAVWILLFFAMQFLAALLPFGLFGIVIGFLASLLALYWPVLRGVPWGDVRQEIGLTSGEQPALEPLIGVGGYLMALPLLGVGILLTLILLALDSFLSTPPATFAPAGGPAHPIILELADSSLWPKLQVLLLAAVIAPLVEETMFRGVLYHYLRAVTAKWGLVWSVVASATLNGLIFAAIHPQGWVAIPALMALAYAFLLLREWRGTLIPSMLVHGISNGMVMLTLMTVLGS